MSKRLKACLISAAALAVLAAVGVTLAFMFRKAQRDNLFATAIVDCAVLEKVDGADVSGDSAVGNKKSDIRVQNTGNIDEFVRLRVVSYFVDADGNITGDAPEYPQLTLGDGWIAGDDHTYYYTKPVAAAAETPVLCEPFGLIESKNYDGTARYQVVELFAEAVQAAPSTAAKEAWGVTVENGVITAAPAK